MYGETIHFYELRVKTGRVSSPLAPLIPMPMDTILKSTLCMSLLLNIHSY